MNTTVTVVVVIISLLAAASLFLALKYKYKLTEITPSAEKSKSGEQIGPGIKKMKTKHSSSTTGIDEASGAVRSEEHTSELQSPCNLVCRLLLEKKKKNSK